MKNYSGQEIRLTLEQLQMFATALGYVLVKHETFRVETSDAPLNCGETWFNTIKSGQE